MFQSALSCPLKLAIDALWLGSRSCTPKAAPAGELPHCQSYLKSTFPRTRKRPRSGQAMPLSSTQRVITFVCPILGLPSASAFQYLSGFRGAHLIYSILMWHGSQFLSLSAPRTSSLSSQTHRAVNPTPPSPLSPRRHGFTIIKLVFATGTNRLCSHTHVPWQPWCRLSPTKIWTR